MLGQESRVWGNPNRVVAREVAPSKEALLDTAVTAARAVIREFSPVAQTYIEAEHAAGRQFPGTQQDYLVGIAFTRVWARYQNTAVDETSFEFVTKVRAAVVEAFEQLHTPTSQE